VYSYYVELLTKEYEMTLSVKNLTGMWLPLSEDNTKKIGSKAQMQLTLQLMFFKSINESKR
jgi:hypothetical protein